MTTPDYARLQRELAASIPVERLVRDPLRLLAWGTDASFYRLVPKIVVQAESEAEVRHVLDCCARLQAPVTFRAAGTSLSGQALSDSVLVLLGDGWRGMRVADDARDDHAAARRDRRGRQPRARAARPQDRPRPGLDRRGDDRRHRRQQRQRHVLRHGAEQLPHAGRPARGAGRRHACSTPAMPPAAPPSLQQRPELAAGPGRTGARARATTRHWPAASATSSA